MIIIGYQGVGKSTLSASSIKFIDLESSNFFYINREFRSVRDENWYLPYCNIAESLSRQGYDVFVSSHKEVRDRFKTSLEHVVSIYPVEELKDGWIKKLHDRYNKSRSAKDMKAFLNAQDRYIENIQEMREDAKHKIEITSIDYDLSTLIYEYKEELGEEVREVLYDERGVARYQRI